jgi:hypothetical protein|nr:MAG TPA: hypothetical protein [Bacteriophage sp.]
MIEIMTPAQAATFREQRLKEEQRRLADQGISSAMEGKSLVTIGDANQDYLSFKHFVTAQIFRLGIDTYMGLTGWDDKRELIEELASVEDPNDDLWKEDVLDYFDGFEGNY